MAQQFYLTADPAPYTPATWHGDWDSTADAVDCLLDSTKTTADLTKFTIQSVTASETSTNPLYRVALARFVSGPMLAQTISGTIQLMAGVLSSDSAAELYYAIHVWATVGDSDNERGTLVADFSELATSNNPFPSTPRGRDLIVTAALSAVTLEDDDRIVVEIGYVARNAVSTEYFGTLYYGTDYYSNGSPDMIRDE
jgi:hypothetical protein